MSSCSFAFSGHRKDDAVYWGSPVSDGGGGRSFDDAVAVKVRWEDKQELFIDADGEEQTFAAVVLVGQDMDLGGYLYLGTIASLSSAEEADPFELKGARKIRARSKVANLKNTKCVAKVWL